MEYSDEIVENLATLYAMSKYVDYSKHPIKKVNMYKSDALAFTYDFFKMISNDDKKVYDSLKRYVYSLREVPTIEGGLIVNKNNDIRLLVPNLDNVFSASILVHECTHALDVDGICNYRCESMYDEVLPFLNQFLFIDYLKKHYCVDELKESHMDYMIHNQLLYNVNRYVSYADQEEIDYNKTSEHFKYVVGSLYSIVLYDWAQADNDFLKKYSELYAENKDLKSLLDYYDVKFDDKSNIKLVKSLMKE